jgi:hypothetical protein
MAEAVLCVLMSARCLEPPRELDGRGGPSADFMWVDPALVKPRSIARREAGGLTNAPWSTAGAVSDRACSAPIRRNRNQRAMFRDETAPANDLRIRF